MILYPTLSISAYLARNDKYFNIDKQYHSYLHPLTNVPTKYQLPTPYSSWDIARTRFYRSKSLRQRSNHDVAQLHPLTNVPTTYQLPTPYGFQDIARTRFSNSRSLQQAQRSNQGQTMTLHTYTPNQCPYQVSTSYTLRFLRYSPDKLFPVTRPFGQHGWKSAVICNELLVN